MAGTSQSVKSEGPAVEVDDAPRGWARRLRGDLDLICLKALRKEPERRYASAAALSEDLQRFLDARPVGARPDAFGYRVTRWIARNRATAVASAAAALAIIGSTAFYTTNLRDERDRARTQEERATAALDFVTWLFEASDPSFERNDTTAVGTFLDRGMEQLRGEMSDRPAVRATLLATLGEVNYRLGRIALADSLLTEATSTLEGARGGRGDGDLELASMHLSLGRVLQTAGKLAEALQRMEAALAQREATLGESHPDVGSALGALAGLMNLRAETDSSIALARRALSIHTLDPGPGTEPHGESEATLARMLDLRGDFDEARPLYESALATPQGAELRHTMVAWADTARIRFGPDDRSVALVTRSLADFDSLVAGR